ncbi:MAG: DUF3987 domain-containing protein [Candidatus Binataceae bacterium]
MKQPTGRRFARGLPLPRAAGSLYAIDPLAASRIAGKPARASAVRSQRPTVEKLGETLNQNPSGVLLFRDEIAGFLATMERAGHENDRAFYLEGWNGLGGYTYYRIIRGTLRIEAACVSILGAITPDPLSAYLREAFDGSCDDGFIQRFQVSVYPDPPPSWRNVDRNPNGEARRRAFEIFQRIVEVGSVSFVGGSPGQPEPEIPTLQFNDEAQGFFDGWREHLERRIRDPDEHPIVIAHLSKFRSLMPSLALIFHRCDTLQNRTLAPVSLDAAKRAAAWCDYLEPHARGIYHSVTARVDTAVRLLGEKVRARKLPNPFTARDVYRAEWTGLSDTTDVARALEVPEGLAWVAGEQQNPSANGGRSTTRYHVNPKVWVPA